LTLWQTIQIITL